VDVVAIDQFLNLEVNWNKTSQEFHHSHRGGFEGTALQV